MTVNANAAITYLRLAEGFEPVFDPEAELTNLQAVAQAINTRLLLFKGEWWENLNEGTPYFQQILSQRATPQNLQVMALALANRVSTTPFVSSVTDISCTINDATRLLMFSCIAKTSFGSVPVTFSPGVSASVG